MMPDDGPFDSAGSSHSRALRICRSPIFQAAANGSVRSSLAVNPVARASHPTTTVLTSESVTSLASLVRNEFATMQLSVSEILAASANHACAMDRSEEHT